LQGGGHREKESEDRMKKIQLCCGDNKLKGWENFDREIDIAGVMPFKRNSVDFIFIEHGIEHVTQREGLSFLMQCHEILKPGGVVRMTFPDVEKILKSNEAIDEYNKAMGYITYHEDRRINVLRINIFSWGHKAFWSAGLMQAAMTAAELKPGIVESGKSEHEELQNIERHWKLTFCRGGYTETEAKRIEALHTSTLEGVKA
jgi:predicted SAM-dependent methyltransferase